MFPMEKINIHGKTFKTFIPYSNIVSAIDEVSEKILDLINLNDEVLIIQDPCTGYNIGIKAAALGLEKVVLRALDNYIANRKSKWQVRQ